jgi:hypothetical protein
MNPDKYQPPATLSPLPLMSLLLLLLPSTSLLPTEGLQLCFYPPGGPCEQGDGRVAQD